MSNRKNSANKTAPKIFVLYSIILTSCTAIKIPSTDFIEMESRIIARLAGVKPGQSLFGLFKDIGLDEDALSSKLIVVPLRPEGFIVLGDGEKWIKFKIEFDRPLYQKEFSNIALGLAPHPYEKSGPFAPPNIKSLNLIYVNKAYRFLHAADAAVLNEHIRTHVSK